MIFSTIFYIYLAIGFLFSIFFFLKKIKKIDPIAGQASLFTKLVWLPGAIFLWPFLLKKS